MRMMRRTAALLLAACLSLATAHAATFTVDTTTDGSDANPGDGVCLTAALNCTLRAAIQEANATPALDTIAFNIPGGGVHTIQTATMTAVSQPVVIDGFTQPGSQPNTGTVGLNATLLLEISGGLSLTAGSTVRGIVANGGVLDFGPGPRGGSLTVVEGCYLGTDATGTIDRSTDTGAAFRLTDGPVRVGGTLPEQRNLVSGNAVGISLQCAIGGSSCNPGSVIQGNLIGTRADGLTALPNVTGISTSTSGQLTIGGTTSAAKNVVSGNTGTAIAISGNALSGTTLVQGNHIGASWSGTQPIPNVTGVSIGRSCVGPQCNNGGGPPVTVGASSEGANLIQNNTGHAFLISTAILSVTHNLIASNAGNGFFLETSTPYTISGEIAENSITGNGGHGIEGNTIIGGATVNLFHNVVTGQGGSGVFLHGNFRARLLRNALSDNGMLGINLGADSVTPNDFLDQDTGPNDLMNFPVLARACVTGGAVTVSGTLHTRPNFTANLEFFRNASCDPSSYGEGEESRGTQVVTTDMMGNATFAASLTGAGPGDFIAATATSNAGETSEFSQCIPIVPATPPPAQVISGPSGVCAGAPFLLRAVAGADAYQWFLNGTPIPGAIGLTHGRQAAAPADAGTYTVRATACGFTVSSAPHALSVVACSAFPLGLDVDRQADTGTVSNLNRVLEPSESVLIEPHYRNDGAAALTLTGTASLSGPAGGAYALPDAAANYGTVAPGQVTDCFGSTADCYRGTVGAPSGRPARHWDALLLETTSGGDPAKQWPVHVGESFTDVPVPALIYRFVETLLHNGVTAGCAATEYCPLARSTREEMAVFVLVAREGSSYVPPACNPSAPRFSDVPASSPYCKWIEELARRGVVGGCGPNLYCPTFHVAREQMAVFVLATREPAGYTPPACVAGSEAFADVPATSPFCRWIEELARRGVVAGCGNGNYCPAASVTRGEMSVFIAATFGLQLYGP